jgi:hypothetical protein
MIVVSSLWWWWWRWLDGCRKLEPNPDTQDCNFYEVTLHGSYIGDTENFEDVVAFLERTINSTSLVEGLNAGQDPPMYQTAFLGVPITDPNNPNINDGRDNLKDPVNIETEVTSSTSSYNDNRQTITIVGGLLVAAFGIAFVCIMYILWKRRQAYIESRDLALRNGTDPDLDDGLGTFHPNAEKKTQGSIGGRGGGGSSTGGGSRPGIEPYNSSHTDVDEDMYNHMDKDDIMIDLEQSQQQQQHPSQNLNNISRDSSLYLPDEDMTDGPNNHDDTENGGDAANTSKTSLGDLNSMPPSPMSTSHPNGRMHFDLGSSFKDQLMGLHGNNGNNHKRNAPRMVSGLMYPPSQSMGPSSSVDGDSDADSWAQTDGTIGSLELQLEPITAEV